jgi:NAD(P)-dependent dehydrogenase (short-subunit alcohol dehydrogenase family)
MAVNLKSVYLCSRAVLPHMIARGGGSIINTSSSTGAHDVSRNSAAYVTSKGGVTLLTRSMAVDYARAGVRVNAIAPGPTDTPMLRRAMTGGAGTCRFVSRLRRGVLCHGRDPGGGRGTDGRGVRGAGSAPAVGMDMNW